MCYRKIAETFRKIKLSKIKVLNDDISIICNDCTAGMMYHDLNLEFKTPTINLEFGKNDDYLNLCKNLKQYLLYGVLTESSKKEKRKGFANAPIGILKCNKLPDIEIHFLHYKNFEEAKDKWVSRSKKVNFNKIFLLIEANNEYEYNHLKDYDLLPYKKLAFTYKDSEFNFAKNMKFYKKYGNDLNHPILKFTNIFGKRGYDEYNFIDIFNIDFNNKG